MAIKTLYVGNLPYNTTEEDLRRVFAEWGPVQMIRLVSEKGFAFVDVPAEKFSDALRGANGRDLNGRALRVDEARPRAPREPGFRPARESGFRPAREPGFRPARESGFRSSEGGGESGSSDSRDSFRSGARGEARGGRGGDRRGRDRDRDRRGREDASY